MIRLDFMNQITILICIVVEMFLIIITAISDITIPHGSALFSKMASMDPSRPFSVSSPPLIQAPQSLAIHIPSLQGREKSIMIDISCHFYLNDIH